MRRHLFIAAFAVGCSSTKMGMPDAGDVSDPNPIDLADWLAAGLDPDAGTVDFLAELTKASLGEAADLDGDGKRELSVLTLADGTRVWTWNDGIRPGFRVEKFPDGLTRYTYWYSNYAATRMVDEYRPGRRVTVIDDNLDFKLDRRRTQVPYDAGLVEIAEDVDGGTGWVEVRRYVAPENMEQGEPEVRRDALCEGNDNFPEQVSTLSAAVAFSNAEAVKCTSDERAMLANAFACAKEKIDGCLTRVNPTLRSEIYAHLLTGKLLIGCGNPCGGAYASTKAASGSSSARMNFTRSYFGDAERTCIVMLHELTHTAEIGFDSEHNAGLDKTYACSNYCGCRNVGPYGAAAPFTMPPSMSENCVRCADTESERRKCGTKVKKMTGACVTNYGLCHAGLGGNMNCETCGNLHTLDCLGNEVAPIRFDCCATCPSGYNNTEKACPTGVPETDTCNEPPPECK